MQRGVFFNTAFTFAFRLSPLLFLLSRTLTEWRGIFLNAISGVGQLKRVFYRLWREQNGEIPCGPPVSAWCHKADTFQNRTRCHLECCQHWVSPHPCQACHPLLLQVFVSLYFPVSAFCWKNSLYPLATSGSCWTIQVFFWLSVKHPTKVTPEPLYTLKQIVTEIVG